MKKREVVLKNPSLTHWRFTQWRWYRHIKWNGWVKIAESPFAPNQNVDEGAIFLLDTIMQTAVNYNAAWFAGLCLGAVSANVQDTAAKITTATPNPPTTNNWQEFTAYQEATRQPVVWQPAIADPFMLPSNWTAGKQSNLFSFTMNAAATIGGGFLVDVAAKGSGAGHLYCVDNGAGSLMVQPGDVVQVAILTGFKQDPV